MQNGHQHSSGLECLQIAETRGISFPLVQSYDVLSPHLKKKKKQQKTQQNKQKNPHQNTKPPADLEEM